MPASVSPEPARLEAHGDLQLFVRALATRGRDRREARLGAQLGEDGPRQTRLDARAPGLQPGVPVVVPLVVLAELGRQLDANDEATFLAVDAGCRGRARGLIL
jgi:hypothetical protein